MRPLPSSVHVASLVLLINMALGLFGGPAWLIGALFLTGPMLVLWMVWQVLNDRSLPMRELGEAEDWGYQDRPDIRPVQPD
jgi:hypothetical protein